MIFITIFIASFLSLLLHVCAAPIQVRDISFADLSEYLWAHNTIRAEYSAAPLIWSDDLAAGAQEWADACNFKHTDGVLSEKPYGENLAAATGTFDVTSAVKSFMDGQDSYNPASPTYSDFTQMVWQDTTSVGCAYNTQCSNIFPASAGKATLHVCLYNPPGNVVGLASENVVIPS
jgi:pathogenesis-related protein 1